MKMKRIETKRKILIVDDEPSISRICARVLNAEGYDVSAMDSGKTTLSLLMEHHYDVYLSDIRMPDMNGMDLYRQIVRKNPSYNGKAIFSIGDTLRKFIQSFLMEINRPVLPKPFTPDELRSIVRKTLAAGQSLQEENTAKESERYTGETI